MQGFAVRGLDIDETLTKISQSQKDGIAHVGALLLAGPLGTLATKGHDVAGIYTCTRGGEARISRLVSHWTVSAGLAEARDVPLSLENAKRHPEYFCTMISVDRSRRDGQDSQSAPLGGLDRLAHESSRPPAPAASQHNH